MPPPGWYGRVRERSLEGATPRAFAVGQGGGWCVDGWFAPFGGAATGWEGGGLSCVGRGSHWCDRAGVRVCVLVFVAMSREGGRTLGLCVGEYGGFTLARRCVALAGDVLGSHWCDRAFGGVWMGIMSCWVAFQCGPWALLGVIMLAWACCA